MVAVFQREVLQKMNNLKKKKQDIPKKEELRITKCTCQCNRVLETVSKIITTPE